MMDLRTRKSLGGRSAATDSQAGAQRGWELHEHGDEKKIPRGIHAQGLDGLEFSRGFGVRYASC